jgi:hypothetical protein
MNLNEICSHCGLRATEECPLDSWSAGGEAVDPCLGILPGVEFACCGHGDRDGYVKFVNGKVIRFDKQLNVEMHDDEGFESIVPAAQRETWKGYYDRMGIDVVYE